MSAPAGSPKRLTAAARALLYERSGGRCEWCGEGMHEEWFDAHHRRLRSRGGTWALSNLLAVHPVCHTNQPGSIHMQPKEASRRGAMLSSWQDPALAIVWIGGAMYQLTDDGQRQPAEVPF